MGNFAYICALPDLFLDELGKVITEGIRQLIGNEFEYIGHSNSECDKIFELERTGRMATFEEMWGIRRLKGEIISTDIPR